MKLTDEKVARAIGWFKMRQGKAYGWGSVNTGMELHKTVPAFTTSLDAIVAEIEARGLRWQMTAETAKGWAEAYVGRYLSSAQTAKEKTPALALCAALLAYLKETR